MKDEPNIVKELRQAERQGLLQNNSPNNKQLLISKGQQDVIPSRIIHEVTKTINGTQASLNNVLEKFHTIFENYAIAITLADEKERIVSWNKYAEQLFNMTGTDLFLKPVSSLYPIEEWKKIRLENIRQKGIKYHIETTIKRKNQGMIDVELSLCVVRDTKGKTVGSIGIIKDITKLKTTEKALQITEERYRTIFENSAVAITLTDEHEQIISWNKFTEDLLGMSKDDLYLQPVKSLYPIEEWRKIRKENIRQKGMQHYFETKLFKKNKEFIDVNLSVSVLKNHFGKIIGSIGVIQDISIRKQMERVLEESEEKFKQLYEKAPIPYHTLTLSGIITDVNDKWCETLGYQKMEVTGKQIFDFVPKEERVLAKSSFNNKIQREDHYSNASERTYLTKQGEKRVFIIRDFFSLDEHNNIKSIYTTMEDITERKEMEKKLEAVDKMLRTVNQELEKKVKERTREVKQLLTQKDEFISHLGHDLKTPVSVLMSILPMIKEDKRKTDLLKDCDLAIRNVIYLKNLINGTLKIAELNSPNATFDIADVTLRDIVNLVLEKNEFLFIEKNISIENNIKRNICVKTDQLRLKEVLVNLFTNAVNIMDMDGTLTLNATVNTGNNLVTISVKDTGVGMIPDQLHRVFDEFYKTDAARHQLSSGGLGLSICKRIIEKHGGQIWAESPGPGKGSTIYFTLQSGTK